VLLAIVFFLRFISFSWFLIGFSQLQENMTRMLLVVDVQDTIKKHQAQIITSLKDPDIRYCLEHST